MAVTVTGYRTMNLGGASTVIDPSTYSEYTNDKGKKGILFDLTKIDRAIRVLVIRDGGGDHTFSIGREQAHEAASVRYFPME